MNRKQRRTAKKNDKTAKTLYSLQDVQRALNIAIAMKKFSKGHLFSKDLKDRCVFCGQTMKTRKQCDYWVMTIIDRLQSVLVNPEFYKDDELQSLWLQHGEEYQNVRLPLNFGAKEPEVKPSAIPIKADPSLYSAMEGYKLSKSDRLAKERADNEKD